MAHRHLPCLAVQGLRVGRWPRPLEPDPDHAGEGKESHAGLRVGLQQGPPGGHTAGRRPCKGSLPACARGQGSAAPPSSLPRQPPACNPRHPAGRDHVHLHRHRAGHLLAGALFGPFRSSRHSLRTTLARKPRRLRGGPQHAGAHRHFRHAAGLCPGRLDPVLAPRGGHLGRHSRRDRLCAGLDVPAGGHAAAGPSHAAAHAPRSHADRVPADPLWPAHVCAHPGHHGVLRVHRADGRNYRHLDADDAAGPGTNGPDGHRRDGHGAALHGRGRPARLHLHRQGADPDHRADAAGAGRHWLACIRRRQRRDDPSGREGTGPAGLR